MNKILLVTGPSGVGKTYFAELLLQEYPGHFSAAKLYTTRIPRPGEQGSDRIFSSLSEFSSKKQNNQFLVSDRFHNNWYGYSRESLEPKDTHLIVNTWPALIPQFLQLPNIILIGLSIRPEDLPLLIKRMQLRGDSPESIQQRIALIKQDLQDMGKLKQSFTERGKIFTITSDNSVSTAVLPWIKQKLL